MGDGLPKTSLLLFLVAAVAGCGRSGILGAPDSPLPATVTINFQFQGSDFPYAYYNLTWSGQWASQSNDVTDPQGDTQATDSIQVDTVDIQMRSGQLAFAPKGGLRAGYWSFVIDVTGGPNAQPVAFGPCAQQELFANVTSVVTFTQDGPLTQADPINVTCSSAFGGSAPAS
jgi:predicted small lipoprotein YifL